MRRWLWENSLSLVLMGLFFLFLALQGFMGWLEYNQDRKGHGEREIVRREFAHDDMMRRFRRGGV